MLVVLDDDPTGTQTVHGIEVVTDWSVDTLREVMAGKPPVFYILTNSRSFPLARAQELNREIGRNLGRAARELGAEFDVVSRSDSTLRGHYPGETEVLRQALENSLGWSFDGDLLIPFFLEGGRYTAYDVHWVQEGDWLVPAGETEFAKDTAFGYRASRLPEWVEEKTGGQVKAEEVVSVSIEDLRLGGTSAVVGKLAALSRGRVGIVNAVSYPDLELFVQGLLDPHCQGRRFLFRTAASFVRARAGLEPRPLLTQEDLLGSHATGARGLIIVGSHVSKSSEQLAALLELPYVDGVELSVPLVAADPTARQKELARVLAAVAASWRAGHDVVVYTSREVLRFDTPEENLALAQLVSGTLARVVKDLPTCPRFVVAKGGITSSVVATEGLGVKRAYVAGQLLPGVPVWRLGVETRFPGLHYVIFPGNVGHQAALAEAVSLLRGDEQP
ncbi:MAG: four-carbon acid sugar kinase family protein [Betaproteobacteria bacterium]